VSFPPEQRAAAAGLSPAAVRFLDAAAADPRLLSRATFAPALSAAQAVIPTLFGFNAAKPYGLSPWPVLITRERRAELARTIVALGRLMRTLPERFLGADPERVARFYGLESPFLAAVLLAEPSGLAETTCRGDLVDTADGLRVVEMNSRTACPRPDQEGGDRKPQHLEVDAEAVEERGGEQRREQRTGWQRVTQAHGPGDPGTLGVIGQGLHFERALQRPHREPRRRPSPAVRPRGRAEEYTSTTRQAGPGARRGSRHRRVQAASPRYFD
jgi:hypothetical protein